MASTNHSKRIVKSHCGLLVDPCSGVFLKPLPGTHFEFVGKVDEFRPESDGGNPLIDLAEAARRLGCDRDTLYNWIYEGKLRAEHGLKKIGNRWRINWPVFMEHVERGEVPSCS